MNLRLIRLKEVMHMTGLARATIYKYMKDDAFPKSVSLGANAIAWEEGEVQDWILEKLSKRDVQGESL